MKFLILRNEKSVGDIADKAYKKLSAKARKQAEANLLKANPELKKIKSLRKGYMLRIPTVNVDGESNNRNLIDPVEDIAHDMADNLKLFEKAIVQKFSRLELKQKDIQENLKAANKELKKHPNGESAAKALRKNLANSKKINDKNIKLGLEALEKLQKTVAEFKR